MRPNITWSTAGIALMLAFSPEPGAAQQQKAEATKAKVESDHPFAQMASS
jgi:hypothetical protein